MAEGSRRKPVKIGVKEGGGAPPGYQWNVDVIDEAFGEAFEILDGDQYEHCSRQVRELARQQDPTHSQTIDVRPVENYYELRDKGGILHKINIRIFFFVHPQDRKIVILGVINKKNDGKTPIGDKLLMKRRRRLYLEKYYPTT